MGEQMKSYCIKSNHNYTQYICSREVYILQLCWAYDGPDHAGFLSISSINSIPYGADHDLAQPRPLKWRSEQWCWSKNHICGSQIQVAELLAHHGG